MKIKTTKIITLVFATFLALATIETVAVGPKTPPANAESSGGTLEVPLTGNLETRKTAEAYETLVEISLLALLLTGFYAINTRKIKQK